MTQKVKVYDRLRWAALIGAVALAAAYGFGSRALDTGSWQQYFVTFALVVLAASRLGFLFVRIAKNMVGK